MWSKRKDIGDVVAPKEVETEGERDAANEEARQKDREALEERDKKVMEVRKEHAETIKELTDKQKAQADVLSFDPDLLNEYLLNVGKEIRG
jgi:hypothetical protein